MTRLGLILACCLGAFSAPAASVTFAWDPPPGMPAGTTYVLGWGTNAGAWPVTQNAGGASSATVSNLFFGTNYVVAFTRSPLGTFSDPSNELLVLVKPPAPANLRVPIQGAGAVTGPWTNIAEFTVPIEIPTTNGMAFFRAVAVLEPPR